MGIFLLICAFVIFMAPRMNGWFIESENFFPANSLVTPPDIKPVWYFSPFYAILRTIPNKGMGVLALACSVLVLFFVPILDRGKVKSIRYRGTSFKVALTLFAIAFVCLGLIGYDIASGVILDLAPHTDVTWWLHLLGYIFIVIYFGYFLFLWVYTFFGLERPKPVPERVTTHG